MADVWEIAETRTGTHSPYQDLCVAVVSQACRDYRNALKHRKRYDDFTIQECEYFFRHDLDLWCDLDGEWIIKAIRGMSNDA